MVTIDHNRECGKSRNALEMILYRETTPSRAEVEFRIASERIPPCDQPRPDDPDPPLLAMWQDGSGAFRFNPPGAP